ncbi:MAG: squalene/phytoene synthase family protein [Candidatus Eremiobacteraeota bacterium]|nr:squalene/phytoene synthase family protein [Candidatus Eremiobacteraeota bacterium]
MHKPLEAADVGASIDALRHAERYCERMARREAKNFYWGFVSLPRDQRVAIYALYDLARQIDDEADAAGSDPQDLPRRLNHYRTRVIDAARGQYCDPITHVLSQAIQRYRIPESELLMLIDGVAMDAACIRYATWEELQRYCTLVASVVGRMCVRIFGYDDRAALQYADELGLALQLTNILRDVREDAALGRIYLPGEDLKRFGVSEAEVLRAGPAADAWNALIDFEIARARELFAAGYRVLSHIPRRAAACVQTMANIYEHILEMIESDPRLPLRQRAALSRTQKLRIVVGSWLRPM